MHTRRCPCARSCSRTTSTTDGGDPRALWADVVTADISVVAFTLGPVCKGLSRNSFCSRVARLWSRAFSSLIGNQTIFFRGDVLFYAPSRVGESQTSTSSATLGPLQLANFCRCSGCETVLTVCVFLTADEGNTPGTFVCPSVFAA